MHGEHLEEKRGSKWVRIIGKLRLIKSKKGEMGIKRGAISSWVNLLDHLGVEAMKR